MLPLTTAFAQERPSSADAVCDSVPRELRRTYRHSEAIQQLTIHRDTASARKIWSELIAEDSTYSPAYYYLSRMESGERSIEYARRAYEADSSNKWYASNYGEMLLYSNKLQRALPVYRRLLTLDNKELSTYHALALLYGVQGMPYSSIAILDSAELRLGRNPYLGAMKQKLLLDTHQYKRAIDEGEKLCEEAPYDVDAHLSLAVAYESNKEIERAEEVMLRGFAIDTTNITTIYDIVDFYYRNNNYDKMLDYEERLFSDKRVAVKDKIDRLSQYTSVREFYSANYFRLGSIILRLTLDYPTERAFTNAYAMHLINGGLRDEAYDYMQRHINDEGMIADDYILLLQYMMFLEKSDAEIVALMKSAEKRFPESEDIYSFKGFYYSQREEHNEALKVFKRALRNARKSKDNELISKWLGYIGDIYYTQGKEMKAFMAYADALHHNENNVPVLNNYAYYLSLTGCGLDKALTMANLAMSLDRTNYTYIDTCAWVLHLMGRSDEAKKLMQRALSMGGQNDPDILAHYGDILWALGEKFMAGVYWDKARNAGYPSDELDKHIEQIKSNDDK